MSNELPSSGAGSPENKEDLLAPESEAYNEKTQTLLLHLDPATIDLEQLHAAAEEHSMVPKGEFHITILGFSNGNEIKKIIKALPPESQGPMREKIKSLIEGTDWHFSIAPERFHMTEEYMVPGSGPDGTEQHAKKESYIQMVDLPGMEDFFKKLNALLGTAFEVPPAHVTMYTGGDDPETSKNGIGIKSQTEFFEFDPKPLP